MLCVEELQVFSSTIEVLLLAPALYLVSQARPTSAKREGSGEMHMRTSCVPPHCTVRYNHIAVFCHMMHYMTV